MAERGQAERLRLDHLLVERGLAGSRGEAQRLIESGRVRSAGRTLTRPGLALDPATELAVERPAVTYASRGGLKLAAALERFAVPVADAVALDIGASTGGFTDVLLRHGAARVYAVDVGYGQLAWSLRTDPRVVVHDRTNIRYLERLPETPRVASIDVSFISLDLVLPAVARLLAGQGHAVCLIKPQFEVGKGLVGKGGVVRDRAAHGAVLHRILEGARTAGWTVGGLIRSPINGPAGNREFLAWLHREAAPELGDLTKAIEDVTSG